MKTSQIVRVNKISFQNDVGGTSSLAGNFQVKITKRWNDYEVGWRYVGELLGTTARRELQQAGGLCGILRDESRPRRQS
jgi:hypothetical protein